MTYYFSGVRAQKNMKYIIIRKYRSLNLLTTRLGRVV